MLTLTFAMLLGDCMRLVRYGKGVSQQSRILHRMRVSMCGRNRRCASEEVGASVVVGCVVSRCEFSAFE